ncbi:class I adenylate-forming enzyme family protein [Antrihabitans stalactiti]|uniref:Long-chain fatty acid--CoA ligase n=1 Tax=Antrihabitans stalactiti TaxID=2584121 RepID=A0A848KEH9_9NOCA|nr:AMP-binding protein [Antrihabitans stalactiti]NMN96709.1 long-chain fatty acid--CoA ligase [Antrihabitans stalactiti]
MVTTPRHTWPSPLPRSLAYPAVPAGLLLRGAARRYTNRIALRHGDTQLSYIELWRRACAFGHALQQRGVGAGDTVALHMPNCAEFAVAYYGTLLAGATFSPTNPLLPTEQLRTQLDDCAAKVVVTHELGADTLASLGDAAAQRVVVHVGADPRAHAIPFPDFQGDPVDAPPIVALDLDTALAHISYTGGTTGRSKGVRLRHANVVANVLQFACWNHGAVPVVDDAGDVVLDQIGGAEDWPIRLGTGVVINLTPWFHAMGCVGSLTVPLLAGVTIVLHDRFRADTYLADADRHRVTSISGAPALFAALLESPELHRRDLSSVWSLSSGAGPLPPQHIEALTRRFPHATLCEGYGLTEATMGVTLNPTARSSVRKPGTVGLPCFDTEIKLVDPDTGTLCAPGQPGEVWVRGPQVMAGYHKRDDETRETLREGWLRTGDIGTVDPEGYLAIVDRVKDMLIYKGYNVYPRELEELLLAQSGVRAAAVIGRPDATVGEVPVALVVPAGPALDTETVLREVNAQLLPYKRLREIHLIDHIPVSAAGKILKRELRQHLLTL